MIAKRQRVSKNVNVFFDFTSPSAVLYFPLGTLNAVQIAVCTRFLEFQNATLAGDLLYLRFSIPEPLFAQKHANIFFGTACTSY